MCLPYEIHPVAAIFPEITDWELERLADDIKARGLHEPITLFQGKILDGRARAKACQMRGVPIDIRHLTGSDLRAIAYVRSKNLMRRQMTPDQEKLSRECLVELMDSAIKRDCPSRVKPWPTWLKEYFFGNRR